DTWPADGVDGGLRCSIESPREVRAQLREYRHPSLRAVFVMLCLRTANKEPSTLPIDVLPLEAEMLRRAAQAAVARQREDQPPIGIRAGVQHGLGHFGGDEKLAALVCLTRRLHVIKRVLGDVLGSNRRPENLLGVLNRSAHGCLSVVTSKMDRETVRVSGRDAAATPIATEMLQQSVGADPQVHKRIWLALLPQSELCVDEAAKADGGFLRRFDWLGDSMSPTAANFSASASPIPPTHSAVSRSRDTPDSLAAWIASMRRFTSSATRWETLPRRMVRRLPLCMNWLVRRPLSS